MNTKAAAALTVIGPLLASSFSGAAFAADNDEAKESTVLQNSKITLCQAINAAERQTGGKAFDVGADVDKGAPRITVETNGPKGVQTVIVDASSGQVVGSHAGGEAD